MLTCPWQVQNIHNFPLLVCEDKYRDIPNPPSADAEYPIKQYGALEPN